MRCGINVGLRGLGFKSSRDSGPSFQDLGLVWLERTSDFRGLLSSYVISKWDNIHRYTHLGGSGVLSK